ncbi:MAG: Msa family membrane protein [Gallicola sp.]|nr:Msa family membrane protein [Gallicola sp.]
MSLLLAGLLNIINYGAAFLLTPNINILLLLTLFILIPGVYNSLLYIQKPSKLKFILLPILSGIGYFISGRMIENSGKWQIVAENTNQMSGDLMIQVADSVADPSQIIALLLAQWAVLFIADKLFSKRSRKNDRSYKFEQKVS